MGAQFFDSIRIVRTAALIGAFSVGACGWVAVQPGALPSAAGSHTPNARIVGYPSPAGIPPPPPRPTSATPAVAATPPVARSGSSAGQAVQVFGDDTVYALSRRYGVSARSIIDANGLRPPYHLTVGQWLTIPSDHQHVVRRGETLYSISRAYGVDVYTLASANGLVAPYNVPVGYHVRIPGEPQQQMVAEATPPASPPPPPPTVASAPVATISRMPPLAAPQPSATTLVPPPPPPRNGSPESDGNGFETAALPVTPPVTTPGLVDVPPPPSPSGNGFMWPVQGKIISPFGPKTKGLHNDGINIAAERGAPVRAAENGVVAYAGNELRGFGNMVLIRHADGWVTAYAHNDELLVRRGDSIRRGEIIARVGSSGSVTTPQLHFELRKGKQAIDPRGYLGKGSV